MERSLDAEGVLERRDARTDDLIWRIERVEDDGGSAGGHFGRKIRVYIDSINTHQVEYLVS